MINPAPNSTRNSSQRANNNVRIGGAVRSFPRKIIRKPVSSSSDSQPNEYHACPTLTMDR
ncbi:Uncharacterised protein [Mycobacterium tuberculosis]|uniref:Uncharacterized protein n=1 Tax=Mycobacterium tuberculosis TaxID=1773 RepID=A0A916LH22_MYCTX|nr:Uncharacterised protein [Mycobacterium tuberculosis]